MNKNLRPSFLKALEEVRRMTTREGWRYQHVQAIIVAIDQYAEAATGKRDFFLNKPPGARRGDVRNCRARSGLDLHPMLRVSALIGMGPEKLARWEHRTQSAQTAPFWRQAERLTLRPFLAISSSHLSVSVERCRSPRWFGAPVSSRKNLVPAAFPIL